VATTMKAKKRFGQNFLIDQSILNIIKNSIKPNEKDLIIEIGPGKGYLTKKLVEYNTNFLGIEIDLDMKKHLLGFENEKTLFLYENVLNVDFIKYTTNYNDIFVVGNLPYYITTPIISKLIENHSLFNEIVIMVQKEVGERFLAKPGSKNYGYYTVYLNNYYSLEKITSVKKEAFSPKPKVDSLVIKLVKKKPLMKDKNFDIFLKESFQFKRKTLKNNLKNYNFDLLKSYFNQNNLNYSVRAEDLTIENFINIYKLLK
jgi:16S rRNA (adenine1518-N6/adenine1519-N6)-dimethyltransferase